MCDKKAVIEYSNSKRFFYKSRHHHVTKFTKDVNSLSHGYKTCLK